MKQYKKIGLGLFFALFGLVVFGSFPGPKAFAATCPQNTVCSFGSEPFNGTYTLQNGQITTTIAGGSAQSQPLTFTFSNTSGNNEVYKSTEKIFCNPADPVTNQTAVAATITIPQPPYGAKISGTLSAYWGNSAAPGSCSPSDKSKSTQITNNDNSTGGGGGGSGGSTGLPTALTYNNNTYKQIGNSSLYGITTQASPGCYGGSVIVANAAGNTGAAYVGLQYNPGGGLAPLSTQVNSDGLLTNAINDLIGGCGFPGSSAASYKGSVANGKLNADPPGGSTACDPTTDSTCPQTANASDCVFSSNSSGWDSTLNWILCPVVRGLSFSADTINNYVSGQLNFSISDNLPNGGSVEKAWATFKDLASAILVIILLVMVISQAIGGGVFDAYTVKKMLPKLVAAVIIMQVSWYLCIYLIGLANDAGQGLAQLMAAPFGGLNALELTDLLKRLSSVWAAITGVGLTAGVITAAVFAGPLLAFGWPILVLGILLILIAAVVAWFTLLARNALIILLVILSPLAFIAWVLPGTDTYWKMWKNNFTRLLIFFPLVIALIYAGRIFAWTAGGLGGAGPADFVMVIVGFFGPYFFLPKTFKWGGTFLAGASNAISQSWPAKKSAEVASRELGATQKRKQNELIDKGYQSLVRRPDGQPPTRYERARAGLKRGLIRTAGGHPIPTARSTRVMMQEAGKWKEEEVGLLGGKMNNDYKEFQRGDPAKGIPAMSVQQAKEATRDKYYDPENKDSLQNRAFFTWAFDTRSFMEMGDEDWRTGNGKYKDMFKTQAWIDFMHGNPNAYADFSSKLGASSVPFRLPLGGGPTEGDYLKNGKRYNDLTRTEIRDEDTGKMVPNIYYNPGLKKLIDAGGPNAQEAASLAADSERFHKLISQSDDPSTVVSQRPEEYKALMKITTRLKELGADSVGAISLEHFIDHEAGSFGGRQTLHRLAAGSGTYVDEMLGKNYLENKMRGAGEPEENEAPRTAAPSQEQPTQVTPPTQLTQQQVASTQPVTSPRQDIRPSSDAESGTLFVHPTDAAGGGDTKAAEAMRQAAEAMTEASQQIRRSAVAQSQVARRLGPLVNQPPPQPGQVVEPEQSGGQAGEQQQSSEENDQDNNS